MKDELTRQCEMAWERGHEFGFAKGILVACVFFAIFNIIIHL